MPRQDVPYGGAICRLKERIAEIWDKLDQKLHSINGVEGDGAGNVEIASGNAAVVINNDQIGHRIEVSLDSSKLPSAAVSSVNGQTGAVGLDAAHIPSNGSLTVQTDIDWCRQRINECFDSIATEEDDRLNADAELQANINTVQASIPGAAAAAVSNDPTVAQLAADVPGKLDKISSGSTLKAYTHTGGTQGETGVVNGIDANSIGLRDGNGRMQAADPAAGATDKTLVTANWVSQTGEGKPNNVVHDGGNETIYGTKNFINIQNLKSVSSYYRNVDTKNGWIEVYNFDTGVTSFLIEIMGNSNNDVGYYVKFFITAISPTKGWITFTDSAYQNTTQRIEVLLTHDGTKYAIWCKFVTYRYANVSVLRSGRYGTENNTDSMTIVGIDHGQNKPSSPDYTIIADEVDS